MTKLEKITLLIALALLIAVLFLLEAMYKQKVKKVKRQRNTAVAVGLAELGISLILK